MTVGQTLRNLREKNNMTLDEVAKKLGVTRQTLHKYETGIISNIPLSKIEELSKIYMVNPAFITGWEDLPEPPQEEKEDMFFRIDLSKYTKQQQEEMKKELEKFYGYLKSNLED